MAVRPPMGIGRDRMHLLPSMMVSAVAATALSWPVMVFSGVSLV